jgi:hypothetical protein
LYCILKKHVICTAYSKKALKQTFVLHTQKNTSFVLRTQKSTQKIGKKSRQKKAAKKDGKKRRQKSWQKICQKSTLPYTQHTWLIIRKKHLLKHILEPVLLLS